MKSKFHTGFTHTLTFSKKKLVCGFTLLELAVVLGILFVLSAIGLNTIVDYRKNQAFNRDTETVIEILGQARSQTLSSKNASQYGVHFATSTVTLFAGSSYVSGSPTNVDFPLFSTDLILSIMLTGGGKDVIFNRLTGETDQNGTIVVDVPSLSQTKNVTIYKTGIIESR